MVESINSRLQGAVRLPHQASAIAYDLFLLIFKLGQSVDFHGDDLVSVFVSKLHCWGMEDLLEHQMKYAIRLANSSGKLEYEEMHKLLSLCDEIYALGYLGLRSDEQIRVEFKKSVLARFDRERGKARMVAEQMVEQWQETLWWYKYNLVN